jgi:N,N'-diacetyllegionaminate synthase
MKHVIIIAEAGVNHNGNVEMAKALVDKAKEAGADYVKFQTGMPEKEISMFASQADYQKNNTGTSESQLDMVKKLCLPLDSYKLLKDYCDEVGIKFMSTPFNPLAVDLLVEIGMDYMKVPSGELTNLPYLRKVASVGLPVIMSTGMCKIGDVENALNILLDGGMKRDDIILLHCNTEYPTPFEDVNLRAMHTLRDTFGVRVGYSDHTKGIEVPIAAVSLGADVIEKHFTLDHTLPGPDHVASLEPQELKLMVDSIRNIEKALGDGLKVVSKSEEKNIKIARKSIIASRDIAEGEIFTEENLTVKRPGDGISPMLWDYVIGTKAKRNFAYDEPIEI